MNFEKVYNDWKIYAAKRHKKQGFETINNNFKLHILPYFKDMNIENITKLDIMNWQTLILDKNFSNNYNKTLYYEFSVFMSYCVMCSYLDTNIVLQVEKFIKKPEIKKYDVYNIHEFRRFRKYLDNYVIKQYFNLMFFYGTRPSEAMALRFIDLDVKYIHIRHSINRHGKRELGTPKNQSSIRTIKISFLMRYRISKLKRLYGNCLNDYYIFGGNKPLAPTTIDRHKIKACNKAKLRPITQHQFRHSYATRMIHKKVPIDYVSRSMGHSQVSMTLDVYLHNEKECGKHSLSWF